MKVPMPLPEDEVKLDLMERRGKARIEELQNGGEENQ